MDNLADEREARRARRLQEHLGLDPDAVELVLYMRRQLIEMQMEMQALASELSRQRQRHARRMEGYRIYYEATWRELDAGEPEDSSAKK